MIVEIHTIQNHAPSNLNRDEAGNPKTAIFGGVLRSRISSQCLKHGYRLSPVFASELAGQQLGCRTRFLPARVREALIAAGVSRERADWAEATIAKGFFEKAKEKTPEESEDVASEDAEQKEPAKKGNGGKKSAKKGEKTRSNEETAQLVYFSPAEVAAIASAMQGIINEAGNAVPTISAEDIHARASELATGGVTPDIAMFGRMTTVPKKVTSPAIPDVQAAVQVAHAISTHQIEPEYDFFTAVDDVKTERDEAGAGMIGNVAFTGSCYYKYASVDTDELAKNLAGKSAKSGAGIAVTRDEVKKVISAFLKTCVYTVPAGKQNSFAANQLPDAVLVEVRPQKVRVSYANAFAVPITNAGKGVVWNSISALATHAAETAMRFSLVPAKRVWFATNAGAGIPIELHGSGVKVDTIDQLVAQVTEAL